MRDQPYSLAAFADKLSQRTALGKDEREALLSLPHRTSTLPRATFIAREGECASHCCTLLSGFAYSHRVTGNGSRQVTSVHMAGDLLDIQNGASDVAVCSVQALGPVVIAHIPRSALTAVAKAHPSIAVALWTDTGANASILAEWLVRVGRLDARSRIAHLVCELAVRQKSSGISAGPCFPWVLTQEQLGDATGMTSVHVNRTVQILRRDGLLSMGQHRIEVSDWNGLCRAADFSPGYLQLGDIDMLPSSPVAICEMPHLMAV